MSQNKVILKKDFFILFLTYHGRPGATMKK